MFDDKPAAPQGVAPQNLPLGEPEDLFAQTEPPAPMSPATSVDKPVTPVEASSPVGGMSASALDAGILKPIEPILPPLPFQNPGAVSPQTPPLNTLKEPSMSRGILVVIIAVVAVLLIGGAAWWVYRYINVPAAPVVAPLTEEDAVEVPPSEEITPPVEITPPSEETPTDGGATSTQPVDENILFGDATDTDIDGLDDRRETSLGTNPEKVDTDADELSDGDEVIIWGTDPLNPDTDGDTFLDGKEVKAGFSPKGPGKLFEVKATSSTTVTSS